MRSLVAVVISSLSFCTLLASCSGSETNTDATTGTAAGSGGAAGGSAGTGGSAGGGGATSYGTGSCGSCEATACAAERTKCAADPGCAPYLQCVDKCPADATGKPDAACVSACPTTTSKPALTAKLAWDLCRTTGAGSGCKACGGGQGGAGGASTVPELSQMCGAGSSPKACVLCQEKSCCDTRTGCFGNQACGTDLYDCLVACKTDDKCKDACYQKNLDATKAWGKLEACVFAYCLTDCGQPPDACLHCVYEDKCKTDSAACQADVDCFLIQSCLLSTCPETTQACLDGCKAKHPAGATKFDAQFVCLQQRCSVECG